MQVISFLHSQKLVLQKIEEEMTADSLHYFDEVFFSPIKEVLQQKPNYSKTTSFPHLISALKKGNVLYLLQRQGFTVNSGGEDLYVELNKIATYNKAERVYKVNYDTLPIEVKSIVATIQNEAESVSNAIQNILLTGASVLLAKNMRETFKPQLEKMAEIGTKDINKHTAKEVKEGIIPPLETKDVFTNYYEGYANSTEIYIKDFSTEEIEKLRKKVANIRLQGGDVNSLRDVIADGRNITENRLKLIVRQETALANSTYETKRYTEAGMNFFKWVHPNPTKETARPHHVDWARQSKEDKVLFDANNPPINPATGKPEMPSEPFNCTCYAVYVRKVS
jgi:hypothetical protein